MLARLRTLTLDGCNLADVPREFCRRGDFVDVSGEVYAYFRALREQGVGRLNECKLIVLGNGRAGKTSLMKALKDEPFDKKEPSTHAIRFWEWKPEVCFAETAVPEPVRISAWDFGGQDIYHQSHRLFLRTRAVFVVVWNVWEDAASLEIAGDEPHPLAYWLEQIVASHPEPRIVLVRTHSDEDAAQLVARGLDAVPDWCAQVPERFRALDCIALSTRDREPAAMDMLHVRLKTMLAAEMSVGSRAVPNGWTAVHAKLRAMQIENESAHMGGWRPPYPVLAAGEFAEIVEESLPADATARDPAEVRGFLHHIGALFYDARLGGRIVLDQRWAIEGLYAILQPGPARDWLRQRGGTFTARELAPLWTARGYTPEEQGVLLDFMRACGQAVEIMRAEETAAGEAVHLAPTLLPRREEIAERLQSIAEAESMTFIEAKGESLGHDAAQAIIGKIAKVFGRGGRYWRWGAQAANLNTGLFAEVDWHPVHSWTYGGAMQLRMRGRDMDLMAFAAQFRETITRAAGPTISWLAGGERGWEALRCAPQGREFGAQTDTVPGREADAGAFAIFAPDRATLQGRHLSFSLAGETAEHPGLNDAPLALYDALEAEAKTLGWKPFLYQRSSDQPDVLRELPHVGKADYVVVFLSAKYLRSEYCMEELRHVYEAEPRGTFPPRTARLFGLGDWRPAGVAGWMALREEWKAALRQHQQDCNARYAHLFPDAKKIGELVEQEPAHGWFMLCLNDGDLAHFQRAMENYVATPAPLPFNPEDPACQQWLAYWKAELLGRLDP
jgi:internalin A